MNSHTHYKRCIPVILLLLFTMVGSLSGATPISFRGGYTRAVMREGRESILLSQGAVVSVGSIQFEAQRIELIGPQARYIVGEGSVRITDTDNNIIINCNEISFDRETEQLLVDGWVEIQDLENEVVASGAYLSYNRTKGLMKLQIAAKLLRHTDSGPMVCRADSIEYDRNAMLLALIGNSEVTWKNDSYRSSVTTINLQTDEIVMEGTIKGTVNG
ncbi:LptA/OstA family protein [Pleomorphochaeta sp. DL1XJH-081]|uniref:LptA/OstA family protein n=1 Tax=Pleomorphochaeta sp. DL1XJH-081 TaxID=3409690 RepID=UPI003BB4D37B